jgi:hypothetical protein
VDPNYRSRWAQIWSWWLLIVALSFVLLEGTGLVNRKTGDTLSENTRRWLGIDRTWKTWGAAGFAGALVAFVVWFIPHILWSFW